MPDIVSLPAEVEMTEDELNALIDARFAKERRKWVRRWWYTSNSFAAGAWAPTGSQGGSPNSGTRSTGSSVTLSSGVCTMALTAGINKSCQVVEGHSQDVDMFFGPDSIEYWSRNSTVSVMLGWGNSGAGISGTPAADTYVALELNGYNSTLPFPTPPTGDSSADPCVMLRARMDTGAWSLYQSQANNAVAREDVLTGVRTLKKIASENIIPPNAAPSSFKLEIAMTATTITAKVDGVTGVVVPNTIANQFLPMSHVGAGVSLWTGSSGTAQFTGMCFFNLIADTEFAV